MRGLRRALMALIGIAVLVVYVAAAYLVYVLLATLWAQRPDPTTALLAIVGVTVVFAFLSYKFGTSRLLAGLNAVELPRHRAPNAHQIVDDLSERMDLDRPRLLVARMKVPNALSLGGAGSGTLVFDRSLFRILDADEFEAIVAHELAHLESHDSFVQTLAYSAVRTLVGFVLLLLLPVTLLITGASRAIAWMRGQPRRPTNVLERLRRRIGQVLIVGLVGLTILVRAHSRRREFAADDRAVELTGKPLALARALKKIKRASEPGWGILSPLYVHGKEEGPLTRMLSTHPPMDDRIERLVDRAEAVEPQNAAPNPESRSRRT